MAIENNTVVCSVADRDCSGKKGAKGLCSRHYKRLRGLGTTSVNRPCLQLTPDQKFWRYVEKGQLSECWDWTGFKDKDGYGKLRVGKTSIGAHRLSYQLHSGEVSGLVLHTCNRPSCVNPNHLKLGDHAENMRHRSVAGNYPVNENHFGAKFSNETAQAVREFVGTGKEAAKRFGVSESQVSNIRNGRQRKPLEPAA